MAKFKVRHALLSYVDDKGVARNAFRGQVVELTDSEAQRLMPYGAITPPDQELQSPGVLMPLSASPSDEEIIGWIAAANASEVGALVTERPEMRPRVEAALISVGAYRDNENMHMEEVKRALDGAPPLKAVDENGDIIMDTRAPATSGIMDINSSQSDSTGRDDTDTSGSGDNDDITILPPGAVVPPVDYAAIVTGSAEEVAGYISTHPTEANEVLAAEEAATSGAPRADVVLAARSAIEFNEGNQ
jgi:hypothetical protein